MRSEGRLYRRCGCADLVTGRQLDTRCPGLAGDQHGSWYIGMELPPALDGTRRRIRRGGYPDAAAAGAVLTSLRIPGLPEHPVLAARRRTRPSAVSCRPPESARQ